MEVLEQNYLAMLHGNMRKVLEQDIYNELSRDKIFCIMVWTLPCSKNPTVAYVYKRGVLPLSLA